MFAQINDEVATDFGMADNPNDGPVSGNFNPEGAAMLSIFDGMDAGGEWRLTITDDNALGNDVGTLYSWGLKFTF